jgi:hypothetical protein
VREASIEADGYEIRFGLPDEWRDFARRNRQFMEALPNLFGTPSERALADQAIICAHGLVLAALDLQVRHFQFEETREVVTAYRDHSIWRDRFAVEPATPTGQAEQS